MIVRTRTYCGLTEHMSVRFLRLPLRCIDLCEFLYQEGQRYSWKSTFARIIFISLISNYFVDYVHHRLCHVCSRNWAHR